MIKIFIIQYNQFFAWLFCKRFLDEKLNRKKEAADKKTVYNWLKNNTEDEYELRFKTVFEIAKGTGLSEERVKHICTIHKEIKKHENEFGLYEWKSVYEERSIFTL